MYNKWIIPEPVDDKILDSAVKRLNISPTITAILSRRGHTTEEEIHDFLYPAVENLHDPFLMRDMERAVGRIIRAVKNKERILIYGDYDVDGVTGTSLLIRLLKRIGADVCYYIPHRRREGYGLSLEGVKYALKHYVNLIITVDCGSGAAGVIGEALKNEIDVIVTDHHEVRGELPRDVPFLNPLFDDYPFKYLSGCGVAFKLARGIVRTLGLSEKELFWEFDLVALSTVCDVVPLIGENRIFVKHGMRCIKKSRNRGVRALLDVSGLKGKDITTYHLGFVLGPRVNAQGRLEDASLAVRLFITEDEQEALLIARKLSIENQKRMTIERKIVEEASLLAEKMKGRYGFVIDCKDWHPGVVGIAASRIAGKFYRPTVLISVVDGIGKGSGRSIPEFNLYDALKECQDMFLSFGGHKFACGIKIDPANIEKFRESFDDIAKRELEKQELVPKLQVDAAISLEDITPQFVEELSLLAPYGTANPVPVFLSRGLQVVGYPNLIKNQHLKFNLSEKGKLIKAIAFNNKELDVMISTGSFIDAVYQVMKNQYDSRESIELNIKDVRLCP
ncbi:single-stranded-DNA-specific exonuclease RecJ [candidate division WOR-3 bacterium JGI_Cruoil_03_44_89]|uniref:Single-stranded-DNA-specific exonuclease RecJ n=1 Tax=candidate division WOR-3 bacterium JGI_Cruoil_03_44_89 TaxID=1973748 RepID=A0A235BNJ0_UNCW3|nr:MAG: single-stranded-DNA-specific exonuclease RecJ [candidate division WOR-3 bacterium JGI_Cruoil_03_44_89]